MTPEGLWRYRQDGESRLIGPPVEVVARITDERSGKEGRLVRWRGPDGRMRCCVLLLEGWDKWSDQDSSDILEPLIAEGFLVPDERCQRVVLRYIADTEPQQSRTVILRR